MYKQIYSKIKKTLLYFLIFAAIISCKNNEKQNQQSSLDLPVISKNKKTVSNEMDNFYFPDTVRVGHWIKGNLYYNLSTVGIDSNKIADRSVYLHIITNKSHSELNAEQMMENGLHLIFEDSLLTGNLKFGAGFDSTGTNFLHGVIEDLILLKGKKEEDADSLEVIHHQTIFTKKVFVMDTIR